MFQVSKWNCMHGGKQLLPSSTNIHTGVALRMGHFFSDNNGLLFIWLLWQAGHPQNVKWFIFCFFIHQSTPKRSNCIKQRLLTCLHTQIYPSFNKKVISVTCYTSCKKGYSKKTNHSFFMQSPVFFKGMISQTQQSKRRRLMITEN